MRRFLPLLGYSRLPPHPTTITITTNTTLTPHELLICLLFFPPIGISGRRVHSAAFDGVLILILFFFFVHQTKEFSVLYLSHSIFRFFEQDGSRRVKKYIRGLLLCATLDILACWWMFLFFCFLLSSSALSYGPWRTGRMLGCHAVVPASPMVIPMVIPGVFTATSFFSSSFFIFRTLYPKKKIYFLSFSKFVDLDSDEAHDVMLATAMEHSATQRPSPGTGRGLFLHVFPGFDSEDSDLVWTRVAKRPALGFPAL